MARRPGESGCISYPLRVCARLDSSVHAVMRASTIPGRRAAWKHFCHKFATDNMYPSDVSPGFGDLLKQLRKRAGMSQSDLAAATGYSARWLAPWNRTNACPTSKAWPTPMCLPSAYRKSQFWPPSLWRQRPQHAASGCRPLFALQLPWLDKHNDGGCGQPRLPLLPTELIGRDDEVEQLCRRLLGHKGAC